MAALQSSLILVADDDLSLLQVTDYRLRNWGYRVGCAQTKVELFEQLSKEEPAVLLLDLRFGEHDGAEILQEVLRQYPALVVVMFTGHGSIESAVSAIKLGAYDYLTKPVHLGRLRTVLEHAIEQNQLNRQQTAAPPDEVLPPRTLLGNSPAMQHLREIIASVADADVTVLILGESGSGKELAARALHAQGRRRRGPFVPVNMAALPRELVESTLFGHEKGSFTGADQTKIGCCEAADGGVLFLDEIGEMDLNLQAKLLRFLQEHTVQRVGSMQSRKVNVRVIAATNRNLLEAVARGTFREDLYYRLNVIPIMMPPLRERREDIPQLARWFLHQAALRHNKPRPHFTEEALQVLSAYPWPGNVRQLENVIERLVILCRSDILGREALPAEVQRPVSRPAPAPASAAMPTRLILDSDETPPIRTLEELEKSAIIAALSQTRGNVKEAARLLGLGQATVYRKIKAYGIILEEQGRLPNMPTDPPDDKVTR